MTATSVWALVPVHATIDTQTVKAMHLRKNDLFLLAVAIYTKGTALKKVFGLEFNYTTKTSHQIKLNVINARRMREGYCS